VGVPPLCVPPDGITCSCQQRKKKQNNKTGYQEINLKIPEKLYQLTWSEMMMMMELDSLLTPWRQPTNNNADFSIFLSQGERSIVTESCSTTLEFQIFFVGGANIFLAR
jgi:hypothetical protein